MSLPLVVSSFSGARNKIMTMATTTDPTSILKFTSKSIIKLFDFNLHSAGKKHDDL